MEQSRIKKCIFCELLHSDIETNVHFVAELKSSVVLLHKCQNYKGRCILIAKEHLPLFPNTGFSKLSLVTNDLLVTSRAIKEVFSADLINFASLGNQIDHFHYHIIPRYESDSNWGMPPWPYHCKEVSRQKLANIKKELRSKIQKYLYAHC